MRVNIKPLSVNVVWQGKRFKTPAYKAYEQEVMLKLKPLRLPEKPYKLVLEFGLSNMQADWDNPIKPFVDILQKKYGFNDRDIHEGIVKKVKTAKGEEYIEFSLEGIQG